MRGGLGAILGPHQRGARPLQRQDRERTGGQKMLLGAALMIALMADRDDDAGLIVVPAVGGNAGALAQLERAAVAATRSLPEVCRRRRASHRRRRRAAQNPRPWWREDRWLRRRRARPDVDQVTVFDHVRERFAGLDVAGEGEEYRTRRVFEF